MEELLLDILAHVREDGSLGSRELAYIINCHNKLAGGEGRTYSKKQILPYYLKVKQTDYERWKSWEIDPELEGQLHTTLRMKPRRTASGVATITVLTKPWPCSNACLYCPNDIRMPKSYLHNEPACQRAERNFFDPYLQVVSRLRALHEMGHVCDKIELLILGGTWCDLPQEYQTWFMHELFRALNEGLDTCQQAHERREQYRDAGLESRPELIEQQVAHVQSRIDSHELSFNEAFDEVYRLSSGWDQVSRFQATSFQELQEQQHINESAQHRVVGLVIETRPDTITPQALCQMRKMGCTKVQMGIQSLDEDVLAKNDRVMGADTLRNAFELLRAFGFKTHVHMMVNLYGSSVQADKLDYERLVSNAAYRPDEVKLYPCALVAGTGLQENYADGSWQPYTQQELLDVLEADVVATPPCTRITRMIRDISSEDIIAGNKVTNLRQIVENELVESKQEISEIRMREIFTHDVSADELTLEDYTYTTTNSIEHFLQWTTPQGGIAGFLRLSLPEQEYVRAHERELPVHAGEAMIREVHVYGKVAQLGAENEGVQHRGLGSKLVAEACRIAAKDCYTAINVISSVGTRGYYRKLGFADGELYQTRELS